MKKAKEKVEEIRILKAKIEAIMYPIQVDPEDERKYGYWKAEIIAWQKYYSLPLWKRMWL